MRQAFRRIGLAGVAVAVCVATASGSFIAALNHTSVARVLFIMAIAPVLAALIARVTLGEPITRRAVAAMALALGGVALMLGAPGEGSLAGDGLSLLAALAFAVMIVITRWRHDVSMAPATCLAQAILVVVFLPFASPGEIDAAAVGWLAALGIGQIGLGFALLTVGARLIPAAQVGLITLLEVVLGPLWVWLALDERPGQPHAGRRGDRDRRDRFSSRREPSRRRHDLPRARIGSDPAASARAAPPGRPHADLSGRRVARYGQAPPSAGSRFRLQVARDPR